MTTIPSVTYVRHHLIFVLNWIQNQVIQISRSLANGKLNVLINYFQNFDIFTLELLDFFCKKINYFNSNLQIIGLDMALCMH
jgi:hypothetical protein